MNDRMRAALVLDELSTDHKIGFRAHQALEFVVLASHGNANPADVIELINKIDEIVPKKQYGPGNPNNGQSHHLFEIGNESSRVIYVEVITAYLPEGYDRQELAKRLCTLGKRAHADEVSLWDIDRGSFTIRFWWD